MPTAATEIRKNWSRTLDSVSRDKPVFFTRTHDNFVISDYDVMFTVLEAYKFTANRFVEKDGTITLSLNEIDLIENGKDDNEALSLLKSAIKEYALDFYTDFSYWSAAPNRKKHIPYILKTLITKTEELEVTVNGTMV